MIENPICPSCKCSNTYFDGSLYVCIDCTNEWVMGETEETHNGNIVRDSSGEILNDGDSVHIIKDLKVKGSSMVIKRGTKVKSIRLTDNSQEVDCKIGGSAIVLRTEFLKKG